MDAPPEVEVAHEYEHALPVGPAPFRSGAMMPVPHGQPFEATVAKVLQTIADPATLWGPELAAIWFDAAAGNNVDRALIQTVEKQVRAMTREQLEAMEAGLAHVDDGYLSTIRKDDPNRLKLERGQQIGLLISDVVHRELGNRPVPQVEVRYRFFAKYRAKRAERTRLLAKPTKAQAERARTQAVHARKQAVVDGSLHTMTQPLGNTRARVTEAGKVLPSRPKVDICLNQLFRALPVRSPSPKIRRELVWESKPTPESDEKYINQFRGHIGRTLLRMDTHHLVNVLANLDHASDAHKNDFRFGILCQAVKDQLTHRGYETAQQALTFAGEVLDTLRTPADRADPVQVASKLRQLMEQLTNLAIGARMPAETFHAMVFDTLASYADQPAYREAVSALIRQMPDELLFAIADSGGTRVMNTQGDRWITSLAASRRQVLKTGAECTAAVTAATTMLGGGGAGGAVDPAGLVSALARVQKSYEHITTSSIPLNELASDIGQLGDSLNSLEASVFNAMTLTQLRSVVSFFASTRLDMGDAFISVISARLHIGEFVDAAAGLARALDPQVLSEKTEGFVPMLLATQAAHEKMKAVGVQVTDPTSQDPIPQHANEMLIAAKHLFVTVPADTFAEMKMVDLLKVQTAFKALQIDPGLASRMVIARRLGLASDVQEVDEEFNAQLADKFPLAELELEDDVVAAPVPGAELPIGQTARLLANITSIVKSGRDNAWRSVTLQYDSLIDEVVASGAKFDPSDDDQLAQANDAAVSLVMDALAHAAQTSTGATQVGVLLRHLPPSYLKTIGTSTPSARVSPATHNRLIELVNDTWAAEATAVSARFDAAVAQCQPASAAALRLVLARHSELAAWEISPRKSSLDLLATALLDQVSQIAELDAAEIASLSNMGLGPDFAQKIGQASAVRATALSARHASLWAQGLAGLRAGRLDDAVRALRRATHIAGEMNLAHHLPVANAPMTTDSSRDFHDALMQRMWDELGADQQAEVARLITTPEIRGLIWVLEAPSVTGASGVDPEQVSQRKMLSDDLKRLGPPGAVFDNARASVAVLEVVEQAFAGDLGEDIASTQPLPVAAPEIGQSSPVPARRSSSIDAAQEVTLRRWRNAMSLLSQGELARGLVNLKDAVSLTDEVAQLQWQEGGGIGTVSEHDRQATITQMKLSENQMTLFAQALNRPDVRELIEALRAVAGSARADTNPALPVMRAVLMDLELVREKLNAVPELDPVPEFESLRISAAMREVVIEGFRTELGLRGERLAKEAFESHSPVRPRRPSPV
ncbi:hypothetical protein [Caenimonas sp. SL110]|uniref:hypothetical protein n=1 Tax=Caenimonas sp. SL110 TaxID=1450524 RepID=UPI00128BC7CB|nr:hypothetical protein [Caenimonas sp. SL110]